MHRSINQAAVVAKRQMATQARALVVAFLLLVICAPSGNAAQRVNTQKILEKVDNLYRGQASHGLLTMTITTAHWQRTLLMEYWSKGKDRFLTKIRTPQKERGTALLRVGHRVWNYLPRVKKVINLPSSMMSASVLGSHFSYDDLVKISQFGKDYSCQVTYDGWRGGQQVLELTCLPKPRAPVVWGKVLITVRPSDLLPLAIRHFDEELRPVRTTTFSNLKTLGGRLLPTRVTLTLTDKPGEHTVLTYHDIDFNPPISNQRFSLSQIQD